MKNILVGITGGVAAYKIPDLIRNLIKNGYIVKVVLTKAAKAFVTTTTLKAINHDQVYETLFEQNNEQSMLHIELARWADIILIAPASANIIAKLAHGFADDLLSTVCLAAKGKVIIAPAMNQTMWLHPATQANTKILKQRNIVFLGPEDGEQACGEIGFGRMFDPNNILSHLELQSSTLLKGLHILITAGPTQEPIDPTRFISNYSSGKMGYALANAAINMGADVILISGPVSLPQPRNTKLIHVKTADEMLNAVRANSKGQDIFISTAAVADYQANEIKAQKIKKNQDRPMTLQLKPTPDILSIIANEKLCPFIVGFAAETENIIKNAYSKLKNKKVNIMIVNNVADKNIGFDSDDNEITILFGKEKTIFERTSKINLATQILQFIATKLSIF